MKDDLNYFARVPAIRSAEEAAEVKDRRHQKTLRLRLSMTSGTVILNTAKDLIVAPSTRRNPHWRKCQ